MAMRSNDWRARADLDWAWGLLLPLALLLSAGLVFGAASRWLAKDVAYLLGFAFYWLCWGGLLTGWVVKRKGLGNLLKDRQPLFARQNGLAALLWVVITGVSLAMYGRDWLHAPWVMIVVAIPLAAMNGLCEELFWRGLYVRAFPRNPWLAILVPAIGFALWHFVPQMLYPSDNRAGFVLSTFFLGLAYGWIAYRTGSAKWTAISHSVNGALALAAPLAQILVSLL